MAATPVWGVRRRPQNRGRRLSKAAQRHLEFLRKNWRKNEELVQSLRKDYNLQQIANYQHDTALGN